jgi:hypothetical protein
MSGAARALPPVTGPDMRTGHLLQGPTPGEYLGCSRSGQDQQRPRPDGPAGPDHRRGPVRGGWSGGPRRARATQAPVRGAGRAGSEDSHAGYHPSVVASGWGSPVSAASAAATSDRLART